MDITKPGVCRNVSTIVTPLTDLLSTKRCFEWSCDCEHAFLAAKDLLLHEPVLAAPDFCRPFKLKIDAGFTGAGAVLLQQDDQGPILITLFVIFQKSFLNVNLTVVAYCGEGSSSICVGFAAF